jgi:hypothetical protein
LRRQIPDRDGVASVAPATNKDLGRVERRGQREERCSTFKRIGDPHAVGDVWE